MSDDDDDDNNNNNNNNNNTVINVIKHIVLFVVNVLVGTTVLVPAQQLLI